MTSFRFGGARFVAYPQDHEPRHIHVFLAEAEVIVDLRENGTVSLAERDDAIRPGNAKRADVRKALELARSRCGRRCMAGKKHRVTASDAQLSAALDRAREFARSREDRRAVRAKYEASGDHVVVFLADGIIVSIPRIYLQGLERGTKTELSEIEITGGGTGLHWPRLDADHYVPGLLNQVFGTRKWMSDLGKRGGSARTEAKARAARENGAKGGRPKKSVSMAPKKKKSA